MEMKNVINPNLNPCLPQAGIKLHSD